MDLSSEQIDHVTVLHARGELTVPTAPEFLRRARLLLAPVSIPQVVVDLSGVHRADASGFAALVALLRHVQRRRGDVSLVGLTPAVRLVLELMQLHLLFETCEDVAAAIDMLAAGRPAEPIVAAPPSRLLGRIRPPGVLSPPRRIAS